MRKNRILLAGLLVLLSGSATAGERYPLVYDWPCSADMGAQDIGSLVRGVNHAVDLGFDHLSELPLIGGIPIRLGRFVLIDGPLSILAIWVQHEVFGHGARGREFGLDPTFHIAVPPPYGFNVSGNRTSWSAEEEARLPFEKRVILTTEGQESEVMLMRELVRQSLVSGKWRRALDTVLMIRVMGDLSRITRDSDWTYYKSILNESGRNYFTPEWPAYLRWGLDPLLWWAVYDYFYLNIVLGEPAGPLPTIDIGSVSLFPRPSLRWAPWGEELGVAAFVLFPGAIAEGEILFGSQGDGMPSFAFMGRVTFIELLRRLDLGGQLGFWAQPNVTGGLVEVDCTISLFDWGKVYGRLGYKSDGYAVGRQYNAGVFAQAGVVLSF
jgi:hypothetical protein